LDLYINDKACLIGEVSASSSKNAILPILAASLLTEEDIQINKVPNIKDVKIITELIYHLGIEVENNGD
jgi:UDP-N-acetylglucosamine 1-carboxyvinyltransferase